MSNVFKLDDITAAADKIYSHFSVDLGDDLPEVVLRNVLRLSDEERKVMAADDEGDDEKTTVEKLEDQIRALVGEAASEGADRLIAALDHNLAHLVQLMKTYNEETEAGEA